MMGLLMFLSPESSSSYLPRYSSRASSAIGSEIFQRRGLLNQLPDRTTASYGCMLMAHALHLCAVDLAVQSFSGVNEAVGSRVLLLFPSCTHRRMRLNCGPLFYL